MNFLKLIVRHLRPLNSSDIARVFWVELLVLGPDIGLAA